MSDALFRDFRAHQAACGVVLQTPRLVNAWNELLIGGPDLEGTARTEAYLWLLVAHQFSESLKNVRGYKPTVFASKNRKDLSHVRNLWEHSDEKLVQQVFPWSDTRMKGDARRWLDDNFPGNWALVYSLSGQADHLRIAELVDVSAITTEACAFAEHFHRKYD